MGKTRISSISWQEQLSQALHRAAKADALPRLTLVGIGNEINGDDAAGVGIVRALKSRLPERSDLMLLNAGLAPENFTGVVRRFRPDIVILIDAAQMDEPPGTVRWYSWQAAGGMSASTHVQPLSTLSEYLMAELGCQVALLCIQPDHTDPGRPISPQVRTAISRITDTFINVYREILPQP